MRMISASNFAGPLLDGAAGEIPAAAAIPAVLRRSLRFTSLDPSRCHEELRPMLVVQVTDLHHRMIVRGGINELAVADVHARVRDALGRWPEIQQITGLNAGLFDRLDTIP